MPTKQYKYEVIIKNTIDNRNLKSGVDETEKQLTRTEKRIQKQIETLRKYEKSMAAAEKAQTALAKSGNAVTGGGVTVLEKALAKSQKETQKLKTDFDALKRSIEEVQKIKTKLGGGSGGNGSGGSSGGGNTGGGDDLYKAVLGGNLVSRAITKTVDLTTSLITEVKDLGVEAVNLAGDFEVTTNALTVFTGSTRLAKQELSDIENLAKNTAGLRLVSAQEGYQQLRALGFQAKIAKGFIKELGEEKILSGANDESLQRVIFNFAQIASGGQKVSQEMREIVTQMPTLKRAFSDAFGTTDPKKIQQFFDKDTNAAFQKLIDAMAKGEAAAGGYNDAWGKLIDSIISDGRAFGEPILEPLTNDLKDLTSLVNENRDTFAGWGNDVANILRAVAKVKADYDNSEFVLTPFFRSVEQQRGKAGETGFPFGIEDFLFGQFTLPYKTLTTIGEAEEQKKIRNAPKITTLADLRMSPNERALDKETLKDREQREAALKVMQDNEKKRSLDLLKLEADEANTILKNRFAVEQALRDSNIRYTSEQELKYIEESGAAKNRYLQSEIARVTGFYDKQLALQNLSDEEIKKLSVEKNKALSDLSRDLQINEIDTLEKIRKQELKIFDERRQAAINYGNLVIRSYEQFTDRQTFAIERSIQAQTVSIEDGYDEIIGITQDSFDNILEVTRRNYEIQLQDLSLSEEQKQVIRAQAALDEQKLTEDNARKIIELNQKKVQAIFNQIQEETKRRVEKIQTQIESANVFSAVAGLGVAGSGYLKNIIDAVYQSFESRGANLKERFADVTQSIKDAQKAIDDLGDTVSPEKSQKIGEMAVLKQQLADVKTEMSDVEKGFPKIQKEILNLYDALAAGKQDYTVFDEIIRKNYEASRALERSALVAQLEGAKRELQAAQQFLKQGIIAPKEVLPKQDAVDAAAERLRNFDVATAIGNTNLQIRANLLERIQKIQEKDPVVLGAIQYQADIDMLIEKAQILADNYALEQGYYKDSTLWAERRKNALLNYDREVFEAEQNSIIDIEILRRKIDQNSIYSANQANAKVLDFLASQKGINDIYADAQIGVIETFWGGLEDQVSKVTDKMGAFGGVLKQIIVDLVKMATSQLFARAFGIGGGQSSGGGGNWFQNILGGLFGGGIGGTPNFNPNAAGNNFTQNGGANANDILTKLFGFNFSGLRQSSATTSGRIPGATAAPNASPGGKFGLSGGLAAAGLAASVIGSFIGGVGGSTLSMAGTGLSIGLMFGGPIGAAIGAGIGAVTGFFSGIFGRNKQRRADERTRNQAILDAFAAMDKLIKDVNSDKLDGAAALSSADQIRADYVSAMSQLKDKKTRKHALIDVARIDQKITQLKSAVTAQNLRKEKLSQLAPTFADGGAVSKFAANNYRHNPLGYITGPGTSRSDSILARVSHSEYILDAETTRNIGVSNLDALRSAKGRNLSSVARMMKYVKEPRSFADGGFVGDAAQISSGSNAGGGSGGINIEVNNTFIDNGNGTITAKTEVFEIDSPQGRRKLMSTIEEEIYIENGQKGVSKAIRRVG